VEKQIPFITAEHHATLPTWLTCMHSQIPWRSWDIRSVIKENIL